MPKEKKISKNYKMCKRCTMDCAIIRMLALAKFPDSQKKEQEIKQFGNNTPKYRRETCPKV